MNSFFTKTLLIVLSYAIITVLAKPSTGTTNPLKLLKEHNNINLCLNSKHAN